MESTYLIQRRERMLGIKPPEEKKQGRPIPKKSAKMKVDLKEYNKIKKEMLEESNLCELKVPDVCTGTATGLQHVKRRELTCSIESTCYGLAMSVTDGQSITRSKLWKWE